MPYSGRPSGASDDYLRQWERDTTPAVEARSLAISLRNSGLTDEEIARHIGGVSAADVATMLRR